MGKPSNQPTTKNTTEERGKKKEKREEKKKSAAFNIPASVGLTHDEAIAVGAEGCGVSGK